MRTTFFARVESEQRLTELPVHGADGAIHQTGYISAAKESLI